MIDGRTAHEIGFLVNSFKASLEKRDLLEELKELRAQVAEMKRLRVVG